MTAARSTAVYVSVPLLVTNRATALIETSRLSICAFRCACVRQQQQHFTEFWKQICVCQTIKKKHRHSRAPFDLKEWGRNVCWRNQGARAFHLMNISITYDLFFVSFLPLFFLSPFDKQDSTMCNRLTNVYRDDKRPPRQCQRWNFSFISTVFLAQISMSENPLKPQNKCCFTMHIAHTHAKHILFAFVASFCRLFFFLLRSRLRLRRNSMLLELYISICHHLYIYYIQSMHFQQWYFNISKLNICMLCVWSNVMQYLYAIWIC